MGIWSWLREVAILVVVCEISASAGDFFESFRPREDNPPELNDFLANVLDHKNDFSYVREAARKYQKMKKDIRSSLDPLDQPLDYYYNDFVDGYRTDEKRHAHNYGSNNNRFRSYNPRWSKFPKTHRSRRGVRRFFPPGIFAEIQNEGNIHKRIPEPVYVISNERKTFREHIPSQIFIEPSGQRIQKRHVEVKPEGERGMIEIDSDENPRNKKEIQVENAVHHTMKQKKERDKYNSNVGRSRGDFYYVDLGEQANRNQERRYDSFPERQRSNPRYNSRLNRPNVVRVDENSDYPLYEIEPLHHNLNDEVAFEKALSYEVEPNYQDHLSNNPQGNNLYSVDEGRPETIQLLPPQRGSQAEKFHDNQQSQSVTNEKFLIDTNKLSGGSNNNNYTLGVSSNENNPVPTTDANQKTTYIPVGSGFIEISKMRRDNKANEKPIPSEKSTQVLANMDESYSGSQLKEPIKETVNLREIFENNEQPMRENPRSLSNEDEVAPAVKDSEPMKEPREAAIESNEQSLRENPRSLSNEDEVAPVVKDSEPMKDPREAAIEGNGQSLREISKSLSNEDEITPAKDFPNAQGSAIEGNKQPLREIARSLSNEDEVAFVKEPDSMNDSPNAQGTASEGNKQPLRETARSSSNEDEVAFVKEPDSMKDSPKAQAAATKSDKQSLREISRSLSDEEEVKDSESMKDSREAKDDVFENNNQAMKFSPEKNHLFARSKQFSEPTRDVYNENIDQILQESSKILARDSVSNKNAQSMKDSPRSLQVEDLGDESNAKFSYNDQSVKSNLKLSNAMPNEEEQQFLDERESGLGEEKLKKSAEEDRFRVVDNDENKGKNSFEKLSTYEDQERFPIKVKDESDKNEEKSSILFKHSLHPLRIKRENEGRFRSRKLHFIDEEMIDSENHESDYKELPQRPRRDFLDALGMKNEEDYSEENPYRDAVTDNNTDINNDTYLKNSSSSTHKSCSLTTKTTTVRSVQKEDVKDIKKILEEPKEVTGQSLIGSFKKKNEKQRSKRRNPEFEDKEEEEIRRERDASDGDEDSGNVATKILQNKDRIYNQREDERGRNFNNNHVQVKRTLWPQKPLLKSKTNVKKSVPTSVLHKINKKEDSELGEILTTTLFPPVSNCTEDSVVNSTYEQMAQQMDIENEKLAQVVNGHLATKIVSSVFDQLKSRNSLKAKFYPGLSRKHVDFAGTIDFDIFKTNETEDVDEARLLLDQITKVLNKLVLNQIRRRLCQRLPEELKEYLSSLLNVKNVVETSNFEPNTNQGDFLFTYQEKLEPPFNVRKLQETLVELEKLLLSYSNMNVDCQNRAEPVKDYIEKHVKMLKEMVSCPSHNCGNANEMKRNTPNSYNRLVEQQLESVGLGNRKEFIPNFDLNQLVRSKLQKVKKEEKRDLQKDGGPKSEKFRKLQLAAKKIRDKRENEKKIAKLFGGNREKNSVDYEEPVVFSLG